MEPLNLAGVWWLPDRPDNRVAGTLDFSQESGIRLSLLGSFRELTELGSIAEYPVVIGVAQGKSISLFGCLEVSSNLSSPGILTQVLISRTGCLGGHLTPLADVGFRRVILEYNHLSEWAQVHGFSVKYDTVKNKLKGYSLAYRYPSEVRARIPRGRLAISFAFETTGSRLGQWSLGQSTHFRLSLDKEETFDAILRTIVRPLQNLLTLGCSRTNHLTRLSLYSKAYRLESPGKKRDAPLEFFYQQAVTISSEKRRDLSPFDMLFTLTDIRSNFARAVPSWFDVAEQLDSVCNLYFGTRYATRIYAEWEFLNLSQALESYHRRRFSNRVSSRNEHRKRMADILANVDEKHREWLQLKLQHSNEPWLARRIGELWDATKHIVQRLVPDRESFREQVASTRNYLTHFEPRLKEKAASGTDLYRLNNVLSLMVQALLLRELGFTPDQSKALFERNQSYAYAVSSTAVE